MRSNWMDRQFFRIYHSERRRLIIIIMVITPCSTDQTGLYKIIRPEETSQKFTGIPKWEVECDISSISLYLCQSYLWMPWIVELFKERDRRSPIITSRTLFYSGWPSALLKWNFWLTAIHYRHGTRLRLGTIIIVMRSSEMVKKMRNKREVTPFKSCNIISTAYWIFWIILFFLVVIGKLKKC